MHDFNAGILPSGLFWTLPLGDGDSFEWNDDLTRASLQVKHFPALDSFFFGGPAATPATVTLDLEWRTTGPAATRGKGTSVPPADPGAFLGEIAPALCTGRCSGAEFGFRARSQGKASSERGYALLGREKNGAVLT